MAGVEAALAAARKEVADRDATLAQVQPLDVTCSTELPVCTADCRQMGSSQALSGLQSWCNGHHKASRRVFAHMCPQKAANHKKTCYGRSGKPVHRRLLLHQVCLLRR
jgi:hypothetical protein